MRSFISVSIHLHVNCSFSALKSISLQDPAYRPLFLKHPDPESQERFFFYVFFFPAQFDAMISDAFCPLFFFSKNWARTEKVQVEAWK